MSELTHGAFDVRGESCAQCGCSNGHYPTCAAPPAAAAATEGPLTDADREVFRTWCEAVSHRLPDGTELGLRLLASEAHWHAEAHRWQGNAEAYLARCARAEAALRELREIAKSSGAPIVAAYIISACDDALRAEAATTAAVENIRRMEAEHAAAIAAMGEQLGRAEAALRRLTAAAEHAQVNDSVVAWSELGDALVEARALSGARPEQEALATTGGRRRFYLPGLIHQAESLRLEDTYCVAPSSLINGLIEALREQEQLLEQFRGL